MAAVPGRISVSAARAAQLQRARAAAASRTINMLTEGELDYAMRLDKRAPLPLRQRVRRSLEGRPGFVLELWSAVCTGYAVITYIVSTYFPSDVEGRSAFFAVSELVVSSAFAMVWVLNMWVTATPVTFLFSWSSVIDLVSIIPAYVYAIRKQAEASNLQFVRVLRLLRALRILRFYRLLRFSDSDVQRELMLLAFTFLSMIVCVSGLLVFTQHLGGPLLPNLEPHNTTLFRFHDALYLLVITLCTVGYGDIVPTNYISRYVIVACLGFQFIVMPIRFTRLNEVISHQSAFLRARYRPDRKRFVVVTCASAFPTESLAGWLAAFFDEDFGNPDFNVVLLAPAEPGEGVKALLRQYTAVDSKHIVYIQGSPLQKADRERAGCDEAAAAFVLTEKGVDDPVAATSIDEMVTLVALALKQHMMAAYAEMHEALVARAAERASVARVGLELGSRVAGGTWHLPKAARPAALLGAARAAEAAEEAHGGVVPNVLLQMTLPRHAEALRNSPPLDMRVDHVVCLSECSCGLLGNAVLCPGLTTLLSNLLCATDPAQRRRHMRAATALPWELEYLEGQGRHLFRIPVADCFEGLSFGEIAAALYARFSAVLVALDAQDHASNSVVLVAPHEVTVCNPRRLHMFVIAEDINVARDIEEYDPDAEGKARGFNWALARKSSIGDGSAWGGASLTAAANPDVARSRAGALSAVAGDATKVESIVPVIPRRTGLRSSSSMPSFVAPSTPLRPRRLSADAYIENEQSTATIGQSLRNMLHLSRDKQPQEEPPVKKSLLPRWRAAVYKIAFVDRIVKELETRERRYHLRAAGRVPLEEVTLETVPFQGHVLVCGKVTGLYSLLAPLRSRRLSRIRPIVIMAKIPPSADEWQTIGRLADVYFLLGSPRSFRDLQRANVRNASAALLMSRTGTVSDARATTSGDVAIDGATVFSYRVLRRAHPQLQIITELSKGGSVAFMVGMGEKRRTEMDYRMSPLFASGAMYTPAMLDSLLCQSFYNPNLVTLVRNLLSGSASASMPVDADGSLLSHTLVTPQSRAAAAKQQRGRSVDHDLDAAGASEGNGEGGWKRPTVVSVEQSSITHVPVPPEFVGRPFWELFRHLLVEHNTVAVGLYRAPNVELKNDAPFCYTAPPPNAVVRVNDVVFGLAPPAEITDLCPHAVPPPLARLAQALHPRTSVAGAESSQAAAADAAAGESEFVSGSADEMVDAQRGAARGARAAAPRVVASGTGAGAEPILGKLGGADGGAHSALVHQMRLSSATQALRTTTGKHPGAHADVPMVPALPADVVAKLRSGHVAGARPAVLGGSPGSGHGPGAWLHDAGEGGDSSGPARWQSGGWLFGRGHGGSAGAAGAAGAVSPAAAVGDLGGPAHASPTPPPPRRAATLWGGSPAVAAGASAQPEGAGLANAAATEASSVALEVTMSGVRRELAELKTAVFILAQERLDALETARASSSAY